MTRKDQSMIAPQPFYLTEPESLITLFDLQFPGAKQRLARELAAWHGFAHAERLGDDRAALVMRPGGALELSR
jgi:hypothetical protein